MLQPEALVGVHRSAVSLNKRYGTHGEKPLSGRSNSSDCVPVKGPTGVAWANETDARPSTAMQIEDALMDLSPALDALVRCDARFAVARPSAGSRSYAERAGRQDVSAGEARRASRPERHGGGCTSRATAPVEDRTR